jgi:hypothetical protein
MDRLRGAARVRAPRAGCRFVVAEAFTDYDGDVHPAGESWTFLTHNFLPYDDGLSLIVSLDDQG